MNYKLLTSILFLFSLSVFAQNNTYFIKYKNYVSKDAIAEKVRTGDFVPGGKSFSLSSTPHTVDYLAHGMARNIESLSRIIKVTFKAKVDSNQFKSLSNIDPDVDIIEPGHVYHVDFTPNDSLVNEQWALTKIDAFDAWDITQGDTSIVIGLIDTGIDYRHPDLMNKIKFNPGEMGLDANGNDKRYNGIDDDGNGFIDDYMGWDFVNRVGFPFDTSGGDYVGWDNDPMDGDMQYSHGTAVAGIMAAETNNIHGIAGVAPKVKLLNCRAFDPDGYGDDDDAAAAILYAVQMGAKVINMSWGDVTFSFVLKDVIQYAYSQNVVLVASAGNSSSELPHYPSSFSEVISVGATDQNDNLASFSNYGSTIDLVAPGIGITTTIRNAGYTSGFAGTSASAPFVSAAAALILSKQNYTNEEVKQIIKSTTDDIYEPGWDIHTGAGRLNLYNALNVLAPGIIKFNYPTQDFATKQDTITINASVLSPYFVSYDLYYGAGLNPDTWISLIPDGKNQFQNQNIYALNLSQLPDSSYTLRLVVNQNNGRTLEERVNFYIQRTPPEVQVVGIGPTFYGNESTLLAEVVTNQLCTVKLYYRIQGSGTNFNFVTLDGFTVNNEFVGYLHYGFVPKELIQQNTNYEVYIEAENLVGLTTTVKDNNGSNFVFNTLYNAQYASKNVLPYTLPSGQLFKNPTDFLSNSSNEVLFRIYYPSNSANYNLYQLNGNNFTRIDSIHNMYPITVGDFNNNGKRDLLGLFGTTGYIEEQNNSGQFQFTTKYADSSGAFWPALAQDIDGDGSTDVLSLANDSTFVVWKLNSNLTASFQDSLTNFTPDRPALGDYNQINFPHAVVADVNNNGKNEIWAIDQGGDLFSYEVTSPGHYTKFYQDSTFLLSSSEYISAGYYLGNGHQQIAVLEHSTDFSNIAPFYVLYIFDYEAGQMNPVYQQLFLDPSVEYHGLFSQTENSIRFADIDNDGKDELILFEFPYAYIFKYESGNNIIISYDENINSNTIFVGDLNQDGVKEVAFPKANGVSFVEYTVSNKASTPYNLAGYSLDSASIKLNWLGQGTYYYIFRGTTKDNLLVIDTSTAMNYTDHNLQKNTNYYYAIQAYDASKPNQYSDLSQSVEIYCHTPAKIISAVSKSSKSISVTFNNKINTTIENLQVFKVLPSTYPKSISPANEYAYLLSFDKKLPVGINHLAVDGLRDLYNSPINIDTIAFNVDSTFANEELFISSYDIINPYKLKLIFNLPVDITSAKNIDNYSFDPENKIASIDIDQKDGRIIYLNLDGNKPIGSIGKVYKLKVQNLLSSAETGNIEINSGAGSYIVIQTFAKDLSDVYVYPNPVKISAGQDKVTFANLPQFASIVIFNINGIRINNLEENNGDGGVDYNLKDMSGKKLSSGVYIFRIVRLDKNGNELEKKIGKFAVIH
jgi:Subtilase family/FG-GAP-like repeat